MAYRLTTVLTHLRQRPSLLPQAALTTLTSTLNTSSSSSSSTTSTSTSSTFISHRPFSSTPPQHRTGADKALAKIHAPLPAYAYPARRWYKQANFGLYGNLSLRFGNNVSVKNSVKTRRKWRPHVRSKNLWSACLGRMVRVKVVMRVLRTLDKVGGLDEYLLGSGKAGRMRELGMGGWALRWRVLRSERGRQRWRAEREALGLGGTVPPWEEGEGMEAELVARERAIDQVLDREEGSEEGGVVLEDFELADGEGEGGGEGEEAELLEREGGGEGGEEGRGGERRKLAL